MKKLLIGTSALVAAGLVAGAAHAADPIKLSLGGFGATWVTFAEQDESFLGATEVTGVDVKGDVEVYFNGSTTLDNGLKISFQSQLEAGGRHLADPIDEYNISVAGSFGTVVMGAKNTALAAIAVVSPRVGGRLHGGAFNEGDMVAGAVVLSPAGNSAPVASFVNTGGDSESISYITPSFGGFTLGATYMPDATQGDDNPVQPSGTNTLDAYGVGAAYNGEFGGVGLKVAGGWLTGDHPTADDHNEFQLGANISYAGFTFGGGYRWINQDFVGAADTDSRAWDLGLSYKTGPYGVSLAYFDAKAENGAGFSDDSREVWELNGEYTMGPGVSLVGGVAYADFENGVANGSSQAVRNANSNDGWSVSTGISLSF